MLMIAIERGLCVQAQASKEKDATEATPYPYPYPYPYPVAALSLAWPVLLLHLLPPPSIKDHRNPDAAPLQHFQPSNPRLYPELVPMNSTPSTSHPDLVDPDPDDLDPELNTDQMRNRELIVALEEAERSRDRSQSQLAEVAL